MKKIMPVLLFLAIIATTLATVNAAKNKDFRLSTTRLTPRALSYIKEAYIDQNRINPREMLKGALKQIQKNAAEILVTFDTFDKFAVTVDNAVKKFAMGDLNNLNDLWDVLREVYTFIDIHYHGSIELNDIEYLAIDGMLSALDPHSNILSPKIFNEFKIGTRGKFGGIGIVIGSKEGGLTVISPIEETPAWRAGIKAGDKIVQIGDESAINMSLTEAVERLRGDVGTEVVITIDRSGRPAPFAITLKRAVIKIDSVQATTMSVNGKSVGYIKIKNFQEDTDKEFSKQLSRLKEAAGFSGLILDMRNNPGGLLNQAVAIADKFLEKGVIVSTIGAGNRFLEQETANAPDTEPRYPMVVLINEGSASASEIVAGTLQSYKRATVIGSQSFGKGSVQTVYDMHDGSALKLTIAEYLTAGKNSIQSVGVIPDIKLIPATVDKTKMDIVENEYESEKSLEGHLAQSAADSKKEPSFKLSYLQPYEEESEDEASRREYSKKLDLSHDPAAQIAAKMIATTPADPQSLLVELSKSNQIEIAKAMGKLGVDWSDCKPDGKPLLEVAFSLQKNGQEASLVLAGDEVELTLSAKNIGTGPFCRLIGISRSKNDAMKNKEFILGRLEPKSVKKWSVPFKVQKGIITQNLPVTIKFQEANGNNPSEFEAIIPVTGFPQPQFAFSFKLGTPLNVKVPKDPFPIGKIVPLIVEIKNIGKGAALNTITIIKNTEDNKGIFIDAGRINIGRLAPGETKTAAFKFHIEPVFSKTAFELELAIIDQDLVSVLSKKIEFNLQSGVASPPIEQWHEGPKITFNRLQFPVTTLQPGFALQGKVTDDKFVKDYFIFVDEDKAAYVPNPKHAQEQNISSTLSLKEGNNIISVVARDNDDMTTRYNFVIEKK